MDLKLTIDALNAEIQKLTSARDTLQGLLPTAAVNNKTPTNPARSEAQRKRWAESKRTQRAAKKGTK